MAVVLLRDKKTQLITEEQGEKLKKVMKLRPQLRSVVVGGATLALPQISRIFTNIEYQDFLKVPEVPKQPSINLQLIRANVKILKQTGRMGRLTVQDLQTS